MGSYVTSYMAADWEEKCLTTLSSASNLVGSTDGMILTEEEFVLPSDSTPTKHSA